MTTPEPQAPHPSDEVARAVAGDEAALTALLKRLGADLRVFMSRQIGANWRSVIDEDDVLQVTYLEVFLRITHFVPPAGTDAAPRDAAFRAWLYRIAENNLKDAIRGLERAKRPDPRKRLHAKTEEDSFVELVEALGATNTTPSRVAARDEAAGFIKRTLARLPPAYEQVIKLYDLQGKSAAEVAALLGKTEGAVFMLRARAHDRLKELMGTESMFFSNVS